MAARSGINFGGGYNDYSVGSTAGAGFGGSIAAPPTTAPGGIFNLVVQNLQDLGNGGGGATFTTIVVGGVGVGAPRTPVETVYGTLIVNSNDIPPGGTQMLNISQDNSSDGTIKSGMLLLAATIALGPLLAPQTPVNTDVSPMTIQSKGAGSALCLQKPLNDGHVYDVDATEASTVAAFVTGAAGNGFLVCDKSGVNVGNPNRVLFEVVPGIWAAGGADSGVRVDCSTLGGTVITTRTARYRLNPDPVQTPTTLRLQTNDAVGSCVEVSNPWTFSSSFITNAGITAYPTYQLPPRTVAQPGYLVGTPSAGSTWSLYPTNDGAAEGFYKIFWPAPVFSNYSTAGGFIPAARANKLSGFKCRIVLLQDAASAVPNASIQLYFAGQPAAGYPAGAPECGRVFLRTRGTDGVLTNAPLDVPPAGEGALVTIRLDAAAGHVPTFGAGDFIEIEAVNSTEGSAANFAAVYDWWINYDTAANIAGGNSIIAPTAANVAYDPATYAAGASPIY